MAAGRHRNFKSTVSPFFQCEFAPHFAISVFQGTHANKPGGRGEWRALRRGNGPRVERQTAACREV
jgi:hypothetical protein